LQLILSESSYGKSYILDSVPITIKNIYLYNNKNYFVIAPIGKAASNTSSSTLHLNKEGLLLPIRGKYKELLGEWLSFL